jgi:hypothetical protein
MKRGGYCEEDEARRILRGGCGEAILRGGCSEEGAARRVQRGGYGEEGTARLVKREVGRARLGVEGERWGCYGRVDLYRRGVP